MAILLVAVSVTSVAMHIIQRKRRNDLRERVLAGQVDLERLGVKRLTVSQQVLDKLPIYTYTADSSDDLQKPAPQAPSPALNLPSPSVDAETGDKTSPLHRRPSVPTISTTGISNSLSQPTCPICLDDFEPNATQVRELPCRHIFHPDCIDTFLLSNSSLCPMCKQSVLPKGDCPVRITNVMVRRERHLARLRARSAPSVGNLGNIQSQPDLTSSNPATSTFGSLRSRLGGAIGGRRVFSAPERTQTRPADIEMGTSTITQSTNTGVETAESSVPVPVPTTQPNLRDCERTQNRREWARQRALALLGNRTAPPSDVEAEEETRSPRWRRTLRKVFPGFR